MAQRNTMPKRQDHMLEALRASVVPVSQSRGAEGNPSLQRGSQGSLLSDPEKGRENQSTAQGESMGGLVPPGVTSVVAHSPQSSNPSSASQAQVRQVVLPLGLGTFLFAAVFLLAITFGLGWLLAGGDSPWTQNTKASPGVVAAGLNSNSGTPSNMRTDFAAFKDPRPKEDRESSSVDSTEASAPTIQTSLPAPDVALRDPSNHYTVQAVEYADQRQTFQNYAQATYRTLIEAGLPAVQPLLTHGKILLVVGAGKTAAELKSLIKQLQQVPDPRGSGRLLPDPYVVPIHRVLP
ncbi:MAG: hypothetical protein CMJ86_06260 [Planctomycetes bacterium]|nr:hypothetical protein [Planctomycetota bacterium]